MFLVLTKVIIWFRPHVAMAFYTLRVLSFFSTHDTCRLPTLVSTKKNLRTGGDVELKDARRISDQFMDMFLFINFVL